MPRITAKGGRVSEKKSESRNVTSTGKLGRVEKEIVEEKFSNTLLKAERSQAKNYMAEQLRGTDEKLEEVSQRLLLKKGAKVADLSNEERSNARRAKKPKASAPKSSDEDSIESSEDDEDFSFNTRRESSASPPPPSWSSAEDSASIYQDHRDSEKAKAKSRVPTKSLRGSEEEYTFEEAETKKEIRLQKEIQKLKHGLLQQEPYLSAAIPSKSMSDEEGSLVQESNSALISTIRNLKEENLKLTNELKDLGIAGGKEGLNEFKSYVTKQSKELKEHTQRVRELEGLTEKLCSKMGISLVDLGLQVKDPLKINPKLERAVDVAYSNSPKSQTTTKILEQPPLIGKSYSDSQSSVAAYHERKLVWTARELGRTGILRISSWFKKMDKENSGFLSHRLIAMALQEVGGADLTEREIRNVTRGMRHNSHQNVDYQELLQVLFGMLNLDIPQEASYVTGGHIGTLLEARKSSFHGDDITFKPAAFDVTLETIRTQLIRIYPFDKVPKKLREPFHNRDPDAEGMLSAGTFVSALEELGIVLRQDEVRAVLRRYDPREEGFVGYSRFIKDILTPNASRSEHLADWKHSIGELSLVLYDSLDECASSKGGLESMMKLNSLFRKSDKSNSGLITRREFRAILQDKLSLDLSSKDLHKLMDSLDLDSDGRVSYKEFLEFVASHGKRGPLRTESKKSSAADDRSQSLKQKKVLLSHVGKNGKDKLLKRCRKYDVESIGAISAREFFKVLENYGTPVPLPRSECRLFLKQFETNRDGLLDYKEIIQYLFKDINSDSAEQNKKATLKNFLNDYRVTRSSLNRKFKNYDESRDDSLSKRNFFKALNTLESYPLSNTETLDLCEELNIVDHEGRIEYGEFINCLYSKLKSTGRKRSPSISPSSTDSESETSLKKTWEKLNSELSVSKKDFRKLFLECDTRMKGTVTPKEFKKVIRKVSGDEFPLTRDETSLILENISSDENMVDYGKFLKKLFKEDAEKPEAEILKMLHRHLKIGTGGSQSELAKAFRKFDEKKRGTVSKRDFMHVMNDFGSYPLNKDDNERILRKCGLDRNGRLKISTFVDFVFSGETSKTKIGSKSRKRLESTSEEYSDSDRFSSDSESEYMVDKNKKAEKVLDTVRSSVLEGNTDRQILRVFRKYDTKDTGSVKLNELKKVLESFSVRIKTADCEKLIDLYGKKDRLPYEKFLGVLRDTDSSEKPVTSNKAALLWKAIQAQISSTRKNSDVRKLYAKMRPGTRGFIGRDDFYLALECTFKLKSLTKIQSKELFELLDKKKDRKLDFEEFSDFALSDCPKGGPEKKASTPRRSYA